MKLLLKRITFISGLILLSWVLLILTGVLKLTFSISLENPANSPERLSAKISDSYPVSLLDEEFERYLERKRYDDDKWLTFMSMLSTVFAVFFVYAWFKIDSTKEEVSEGVKKIDDLAEFALQLQYAMSFILSKQFEKAIDSLTVLRSEAYVLKDDRKLNSCYFFLAHCFYEKWLKEKSIEDLARAVDFADRAYSDASHPFRMEIVRAFNKMDKESKSK